MNFIIMKIVVLGLFLQACGLMNSVGANRAEGRQEVNINQESPTPTPLASESLVSRDKVIAVKGRYRNPEYGYEIEIPPNLIGMTSPPPATQNGFRVQLAGSHDDSISVYAEYNPLLYKDLEAAFLQELDYIRGNDEQFTLLKKQSIIVGRLPAIHFIAKYRSSNLETVRIVDKIISLRECRGIDAKIVYVVSMDTSEAAFAENSPIFTSLIDSWKMLKCE